MWDTQRKGRASGRVRALSGEREDQLVMFYSRSLSFRSRRRDTVGQVNANGKERGMTSLKQLEQMEKSIELEKCFRLQRKLAALSHSSKDRRFNDLYNLTYWRPLVHTAVKIVRSRRGAKTAGVDGKTRRNVNDAKLIKEVQRELRNGSITPSVLRKIEIPKGNGKVRTISIPTYKDRVVLTILKLILEPIYEPQFNYSSYGFRPNMSTHDAIAEARILLGQRFGYSWVIKSDVESCFDRIPHGRMIEILEERIADGKIIQLTRKYLKANLALEGFPYREGKEMGCPQGSPLSPLLCNILLDKLDKFVNERLHRMQHEREKDKDTDQNPVNVRRRRAYLGSKMRKARTGPFHSIRYADDLIIVSPASHANVVGYWSEVQEFAQRELKMRFSPEKTSITHIADGFDFLGFRLKRIYRPDLKKKIVLVTVDPTRKKRHRKTIEELLKGKHDRGVTNVINAVNQRVRGWRYYYQKSLTNCAALSYIDQKIFWSMIKWLMKKFKAPISKVFKGFYHRVENNKGHKIKAIATKKSHIQRAAEALPKHRIDFAHKVKHPWCKGKPIDMIRKSFPIRPRAPTWDGKSGYGENYAKMMRKALERDHYTCIKCGEKENLHVHHINKRNSFQNPRSRPVNCLENLATLCRQCHKYADKLNAIDCLNWLLAAR